MEIHRIWVGNAGRNFNYLVACPESGEAVAIDPLDSRSCLAEAERRGWRIAQVINTHEHGDHTGGNAAVIAATGARLLAHAGNVRRIPGVDRGLHGSDEIRVGRSVRLRALDTPGHTRAHVCLFAEEADPPTLFSGDTLFNAGAGNCHAGGHPGLLYETFAGILARLPGETRVYPGHEYLARNLAFTLDREPSNRGAARWLAEVEGMDPVAAPVTTLAVEREVNVFFRLGEAEVRARVGDPEDDRDTFLRLRELRNRW